MRALFLALLLAACAPTTSGFLEDYSILAPNPDVPGSKRWISPDAPAYDRVLVAPFVAYFHPDVVGQPIDPNELDDLLTRLRGFVVDALTEDTLLAAEPGAGVLRLEVAVTDLHEAEGNINIEMRATDSATGELVAAAVSGAKVSVSATDDEWRTAAKRWAARVKRELDSARD